MIRILIVDDHTLFRAGLRSMLDTFDEVRVVGEASTASQAYDACRHLGADILICDLTLPGVTGTQLIEGLHLSHPHLPILVLSMHDEIATVRRALHAGALGYLTKEASPEALHEAITTVAANRCYLSPAIATALAVENISGASELHQTLSDREKQVLRGLVTGMQLAQIANSLNLSPKTITTHKTNIMEKLGVANNAELIRYAIEHKLFEDETPLPQLNPRS